jgi:hypothetical protein
MMAKELQVLITKRLLRLQNIRLRDELGLKAYKQNVISIDDDHESAKTRIFIMMIGVLLKWLTNPKCGL